MTRSNARDVEIAIVHPGLQVGQLIYTSFHQSGFTLLKSADIPPTAQQAFLNQLVQTHWDTYFPPKPGYRAVYLHQLPLTTPGTLFGWLYHDGQDEFGRSDIPYFMAYYLPALLQAAQLSQILACLKQGPLEWLDRLGNPPQHIKSLTLRNIQDYRAARLGVELPAKLRVESYSAIESHTPLNWLYAEPEEAEQLMQTQEIHHSARNQLQGEPLVSTRSAFGEPTMNTNQIESILKQLVAKPIGIQEAALVSAEGQAIVVPIGIDENTAGILAGTMISLLKVTQEELYWQTIETVSVRSPEGHLILKSCGTDTYLLIKSGKVPVGLLEGEVSRAVDKLRVELEVNQNVAPPALLEPSPATLTLPEAPNNLLEDASAPPSLNSIDSSDNEVTYRGRRTSS